MVGQLLPCGGFEHSVNEAAGPRGQAQVVLLTCTPGRYAAIPQAEVVRL